MTDRLQNVTPGMILKEDFLDAIGITPAELASATAISEESLNDMIAGRCDVTAETDLRLCRYFGLTDGYWLRLQVAHDLFAARQRIGPEVARITPRAA